MSTMLNYGSWQCESCEDIFETATQDEEIARCPACALECIPIFSTTLTYTIHPTDVAETSIMTMHIWDPREWGTCSCQMKILLSAGCQCGGK